MSNTAAERRNLRERSFMNRKRTREYVQVSEFLLGGNISDPLNLASLTNDQNQLTPVCSPVPTPQYNKEIELLIPADLNDPLKLNKCEIKETSELCHHLLISPIKLNVKRNKRRRTESDSIVNELKDELMNKRLKLDLKSVNLKDKIVSPVVPQNKLQTDRYQASSTLSSHLNSLITHKQRTNYDQKHSKSNVNNSSSFQQTDSQCNKQLPNKLSQTNQPQQSNKPLSKSEPTKRPFIFKSNQNQFYYANGRKFNLKGQKFQFGNYNRYYGYRNQSQDLRLAKLKKEWFLNKNVLDIGCNVGNVTCWIARNFDPKKIIGLDIDAELIKSAKRNIRNYLENADGKSNAQFPVSLSICHGPLVEKEVNKEKDDENVNKSVNQIEVNEEDKLKETNLKQTEQNQTIESTKLFPKNISFVAANYVLPNDELLSTQKPEYDCILCLSVTKWVHLNFGDEGVKNLFKRVFLQLKSNGIFVLEPQHFWTYKCKKALTETTLKNYNSIKFKPEMFKDYLLSTEIGFTSCDTIEPPNHNSKGFRRSIYIFQK